MALFMTIKVDVNFRTYFIAVPMLRSRFSTLAGFETSLGIRDTYFSQEVGNIIKCNTYLWLLKLDSFFYMRL